MRRVRFILILFSVSVFTLKAQLSPGPLSDPHAHLEGLSNCTQCHVLGNKVLNEKCLKCHIEIEERITLQKGYHASVEVKGKDCFTCHSDHNGKNFQLIHIDVEKFDHNLTGFSLTIPHSKKTCKDCHDTPYITDQVIKRKKFTYLGVKTDCLNCHADYHKKTLSSTCLNCHDSESFKTAPKFNHDLAKFKLTGKHNNVDCVKCHKVELHDGNKFQNFIGIQFDNCNKCHKDPHSNKFGQNCRQCHTEESFLVVKNGQKFDHDKTNFKLEEKHLSVSCTECHKKKLTDPVKHDLCTDCHTDYHNKQFVKNGFEPDCSHCHTVKGFTPSLYTIEQHNQTGFPLNGSHCAEPCFECHRKQEKWNFREVGINCKDCHQDIHQNLIQSKYYPEADCKTCHNDSRWSEVTFNHENTGFDLSGKHLVQECRLCHFKQDINGIAQQKFKGLSQLCSDCHIDNHFRQFEKDGSTNCKECHDTKDWKASEFNHNNTDFKLDGKHINVQCEKCHKQQKEGSIIYVRYKIKDFKCESCHF